MVTNKKGTDTTHGAGLSLRSESYHEVGTKQGPRLPRCWVLTLPQGTDWNDYMRTEVEPVADRSGVLNYRVARAPKDMRPGDRCYVVWRGQVRGWMEVHTVANHPDGFRCLATGRKWPPGIYIQRTGPFHAAPGPVMTGFRGVRRFFPAPDPNPAPPGPLWL